MKRQTGVSLRYILGFGSQPLERQMMLSAKFLHHELPIRLAHRLTELNNLPPALSNGAYLQRVKMWYAKSFMELRLFPTIKDAEDVARFTLMLKHAYVRHNNVVLAIAKGVEEYKRQLGGTHSSGEMQPEDIQAFLDRFFLSRIALRFLAGNHIALHELAAMPERERPQDWIGLIHTKCSPVKVVSQAVEDARALCAREYGDAPPVTIHGSPHSSLPYVPSHLHHMSFELIKNSLRAVQERFGDSDRVTPPINVVVAAGSEDVTIKVSDQGGGIPRTELPRIWTYLYTTARSPLPDITDADDDRTLPAVLAGYGCGLPLSRLYAVYFGGSLQVLSMQGYGTDAYLHLMRLGNDEEPLPTAGPSGASLVSSHSSH